MFKFSAKLLLFSGVFFFLYREVFKKDLITRFNEHSIKNRLQYERCKKEYKDSYCGIYDIPYLEEHCNEMLLCINTNEAKTAINASKLATRLQVLIKYFVIDNFDLFLNHYIYMDDKNTKNQSMFYNLVFLALLFAFCVLIPLYLVLGKTHPVNDKKQEQATHTHNAGNSALHDDSPAVAAY